MSSNTGLDDEWMEALEIEPAGGSDDDKDLDDKGASGDDANSDDTADKGTNDDTDAGADDDTSKKSDDDEDAAGKGDDSKDDAGEDGAADDAKGKQPPVSDDEKSNQPDYKALTKEAIQEIETTRYERQTKYEGFKKEVAETLYPEGIDRQLRDSDGEPITGIDDLKNLINPKTNDYFTDEEAGAWLLAAQKKLNQDVETVERFIEDVAETNLMLEEGAQRVADKYGELLSKPENQDLKQRLLTAFNKTLVKDPKTGVAIKAPMDVEEFFDIALDPILTKQAEEAEAKKQAEKDAKKAAQRDRGDLKQTGKSDQISPTDKEWATAIKEYEEGV